VAPIHLQKTRLLFQRQGGDITAVLAMNRNNRLITALSAKTNCCYGYRQYSR